MTKCGVALSKFNDFLIPEQFRWRNCSGGEIEPPSRQDPKKRGRKSQLKHDWRRASQRPRTEIFGKFAMQMLQMLMARRSRGTGAGAGTDPTFGGR